MNRVLSGAVLVIGILFLVAGGIGTLASVAVLIGEKSHQLGAHVVALLWALSALLLAWGLLSSRFLFYGAATLVLLGETINAWVQGHTGTAIYATVLTALLLAYAWRWLGELAQEDVPEPVDHRAG